MLRTAIFIDGPNLFHATRSLGFEVDFLRLHRFYQKDHRLLRAYFFAPLCNDAGAPDLRPLIDWLNYNGFCAVTKPAKTFVDGSGKRIIRGNIRVELATHALGLAAELEHVVLMSGDGEFLALVRALQQSGKRVTVVSTLNGDTVTVAQELRRQADHYSDLSELEPEICRISGANDH